MKSILLHIGGDSCMTARLQVAMDIARATGAHITCLQAVSYEVFAPGDFYGSAMAAALPVVRERAEALRAKIESDLSNEDVSWEWLFMYGMAEDRLLEQSALHDLIVVGPHDVGDERKSASNMVGKLSLAASAPVLVVPEHTTRLDLTAPILVAWNNSSEASVALRAATPLLGNSSDVILASVMEKSKRDRPEFPATGGARYLSRYGIEAEILELPRGDASVTDALFAGAEMRGCGLMVMGAYGHSRLSELLFGGVTRRSLSDPQLPILLAH
ncbi:MAG: universal stress protein [Pseudomonadota bacterium]